MMTICGWECFTRIHREEEERTTSKQVAKRCCFVSSQFVHELSIRASSTVTNCILGKVLILLRCLPDNRSAGNCWRSGHSSDSAGGGVESVWMTVGSSFRLANPIRRYRQEESTMASLDRSRSHLASSCYQESLRDHPTLPRCCFLPLVPSRLRLVCSLADLFCYPAMGWKSWLC